MIKKTSGFLIILLLASGCTLFRPAPEVSEPEFQYPAADSLMAAHLDQYRLRLEREMGKKIATVTDTLRFDKPESALGNLVADALRARAAGEAQKFVNVGILGESSFNLNLTPGELTLGELFEFYPYDNHLVILTLSGRQLQKLMDQAASIGGAPVSGVRFNINDEGKARGVLVNSQVIDPERYYSVATTSWAANGGDQFPALWDHTDRLDINISIRRVFADYFNGRSVLMDLRDGRIR